MKTLRQPHLRPRQLVRRFIFVSMFISISSRLAWWTRTFPIVPPRTVTPPPKRPLKTTTPIDRVSSTVTIVVPVVLFAITLIAGFGLIAYASFTGGNGVSFLTRTGNEH